MQMVATIVVRTHAAGTACIADSLIEVDYAVKRFSGANPFVHCFALNLLLGSVIARIDSPFKRCKRAAEDLEPMLVRARGELRQSGDDVIGAHGFRCR